MTAEPNAAAPTAASWAISPRAILLGLLAVGCLLRIIHFAGARALWHDEASTSLDIIYMSVDELLGPLKFRLVQPPGWLFAQKWLVSIWPDFDYSLRALSLACGLGSLLVFARFGAAALDEITALLATGLFAISSPLIQYSSMAKPYVVDLFFAVLLMHLAWKAISDPSRKGLWTLALAAAGLVGIPMSLPAVMVLAPLGLILFARALSTRDYRWGLGLALAGTAWLGAFATIWFGYYTRQGGAIHDMQTLYWGPTFAPAPPRSLGDLAWYPRAIARIVQWFLHVGMPISAPLLIIGSIAMAKARPWLFALLAGPIVTALAVSALQAYPFDTRLILFLAPSFLMLLATGVTAIASQCRRYWAAFGVLTLVVSASAVSQSARAALQSPPWAMEEVKPHFATIAKQAAPTDTIFLSRGGERPFLLYAERYGLLGRGYLVGARYRLSHTCAYADVDGLRRRPGTSWIVNYHIAEPDQEGTKLLLRLLGDVGSLTFVQDSPGAALYRFTPNPASQVVLPKADPVCFQDRTERAFLERIAAAIGAGRPTQAATAP